MVLSMQSSEVIVELTTELVSKCIIGTLQTPTGVMLNLDQLILTQPTPQQIKSTQWSLQNLEVSIIFMLLFQLDKLIIGWLLVCSCAPIS